MITPLPTTYDRGATAPTAELVGKPNNGLAYMFVMMNAARFSMSVQALAIADRAYQSACGTHDRQFSDRPRSRLTGAKHVSVAGARLLHMLTAVDPDVSAGDKGGFIRSKIDNEARNLVRLAEPAFRDEWQNLIL
jgi:alkylation response protein AidB-like acyl-CoA dehydrogenase